jgi:hypothetical protein
VALFDFLNTGDPQKDAAISRGLLQAGLQLMQTKGKFIPGLSQGGLAGLQGFDQAQQQQYQQKLQKAQLEAIERKKMLDAREDTLANLPGEFIKPASQGNNPSAYTPGSQDIEGLIQKYMATPGGLQTGLSLQGAFAKPKPTISKPGEIARDAAGNIVWQNPAEPKDDGSPLARLLQEQAKFPPGSSQWKTYQQAIEKASTHQPPVSLNNYGTPLPVQLPGGGTGYLAPPTRPGGPSQMLTIPGTGKAAVRPGEEGKPATEAERTAGFLLQRIRDSQRQLAAAVQKNPAAALPSLGPEAARKLGEPLANVMTGPERQRVESAQLDILDAALTLGTGAAYTREQLEGYRKSFFPQLGDSQAAIKDKRERLNNLIRAAETKAGKAAADKGKAGGWSIERE